MTKGEPLPPDPGDLAGAVREFLSGGGVVEMLPEVTVSMSGYIRRTIDMDESDEGQDLVRTISNNRLLQPLLHEERGL